MSAWILLAGTALAAPVDLAFELPVGAELATTMQMRMGSPRGTMSIGIGLTETVREGGVVGRDKLVFVEKIDWIALDGPDGPGGAPVKWDSRSGPPPAGMEQASAVLGKDLVVTITPKLEASVVAPPGVQPPPSDLALSQLMHLLPGGTHEVGESWDATATPQVEGPFAPMATWTLASVDGGVARLECAPAAIPGVEMNTTCTAAFDTLAHLPRGIEMTVKAPPDSPIPMDMHLEFTVTRIR